MIEPRCKCFKLCADFFLQNLGRSVCSPLFKVAWIHVVLNRLTNISLRRRMEIVKHFQIYLNELWRTFILFCKIFNLIYVHFWFCWDMFWFLIKAEINLIWILMNIRDQSCCKWCRLVFKIFVIQNCINIYLLVLLVIVDILMDLNRSWT